MVDGFLRRTIARCALGLSVALFVVSVSRPPIALGQSVVQGPEDFPKTLTDVCVLGDFPSVSPKCGETIVVTQTVLHPGKTCNPLTKVVHSECDCESHACDCLLGEWPADPECGNGPVTLTRPRARPATHGGKECPVETKVVTPATKCRCDDGIISPPEECDGADLGAFIEDIRKLRGIPLHVPVTCSSACTLEVGPYCGDGIIKSGSEQCEGSAFAADIAKPADVSAERWAAKKCTADCKIQVSSAPCVEETFVKNGNGCSRVCTRRTCEGSSPTEVCGAEVNCAPCEGVTAVQQCTKTGGIVPGLQQVNNRTNFFTYGKDGQTVCFSESCLRPNRSFDPNALITLEDGSVKAARDLRATDILLGRSGKRITINQIFESAEERPLYRIAAGSHSVTVTEKHVVWTTNGLRQAKELRKGDRVIVRDGSVQPLSRVERLPVKLNQKAIGIWVDGDSEEDRLMFGGGILVGDYGLEKENDR